MPETVRAPFSRSTRCAPTIIGANPNTKPQRTDTVRHHPRTAGSSRTVDSAVSDSGRDAISSCKPYQATSSPAAPPSSASIRLSVSIWRASRPRPAPNAIRTPISRSRAAARISRRLATLAQAMRSTTLTAPISSSNARFVEPDVSDCAVIARRAKRDSSKLCSSDVPIAASS